MPLKKAMKAFPWEQNLKNLPDPTDQVNLLINTILYIMSNFIPNEIKSIALRNPHGSPMISDIVSKNKINSIKSISTKVTYLLINLFLIITNQKQLI